MIRRFFCRFGWHRFVYRPWEKHVPVGLHFVVYLIIPMCTRHCVHCNHTEERQL